MIYLIYLAREGVGGGGGVGYKVSYGKAPPRGPILYPFQYHLAISNVKEDDLLNGLEMMRHISSCSLERH